MTAINRRQAYEASVDHFEAALCNFTGAPIAIATDSATNAIYVCLEWEARRVVGALHRPLALPRHNYVGVYQAAVNAGYQVAWTDEEWVGSYRLGESIIDSAKKFQRGMYEKWTLTCVSFGTSKLLPIGRGGAILLDDQDAADWIRPRTMDGRTAGEDYLNPSFVTPAWRVNMTPEQAVRGLDLLTYIDDAADDTWESYPDLSQAVWK